MGSCDKSEQLLDLLLDLTDGAATGIVYTDGPAKAYQLAGEVVHELEEAKARIGELEAQAAIGRRAVKVVKDEMWTGFGRTCISCGYDHPNHANDCDADAILRAAGQATAETATVAAVAGALADSQLLDGLERVAREYMAGFSVMYRLACDGEPCGFVAMRRRLRTDPAPTLREAARRLLAGGA